MYAEGMTIDQSEPDLQPVSFIIPAHNEAKYIGKTIRAIQNGIEVLGIIAEIIVVNDDSTDRTVEIAHENGARTVDVALRNIGAVRNAGANVANYEWLVFVDADTTVPVKTLSQTLDSLARGDVGGGARVEIDETQPLFFVKRLMYLGVVLGWQVIGRWAAGCYMFCRKNQFDDFGGFDEAFFAAEELFFSRQLKQRGKFKIVTHPVVTSARKLHGYTTFELIRFLLVPMTRFGSMFKSRDGLELLYQDER